jgi:hypothetical protein
MAAHRDRSLGFGTIEGPRRLEALDGVKVGWVLRGEGKAGLGGGFKTLLPGDQIALTPERPLKVEGSFSWAWIEDRAWKEEAPPAVQPLMSLPDTSGGCNVSPGAFRRLQITWNPRGVSPENPDGQNRLNSHVVNIEARFSNTHYHPSPAEGGGASQEELYFVLDRRPYSISAGDDSAVLVFPELADLSVFERIPLQPGDVAYFAPRTGHRGLDVFVNVVALPGFKPGNEIPLDRRIRDTAPGVPFNRSL